MRSSVFIGILLAAATVAVHAQQAPARGGGAQGSNQAPGGNFTGGEVQTIQNPEGRLSYYILGPGARTKWHVHERGQLILAEEGVARTQQRGKPTQDLRPGESVWSGPGVAHWHGAAPGNSTKLYQIARGTTTWLEPVTDADYNSSPKAR